MKVLIKFASRYDLKLTLNLEITNTDGISWQRNEEMQAALRELGLDDEISAG